MLIEQAIFTSAQSDHAVGYHLVARSPGVDDRDARELTVWGPSHDSLESSTAASAVSVNFFRLPSGAYCVSKTQIAGEEYSGRGLRTYTHCLIVPPQVLTRFANSPFALLRAAWAKGQLRVSNGVPQQLVPFQLAGRAAPVDEGLIGQFVEQCGAEAIGPVIESVLDSKPVVLIGVGKPEAAVAGLINLFPVSCRRELPFATGLKYSPRRPFRLLVAPAESAELRRLHRQQLVALVDPGAQASSPATSATGWGGYIADAVARDALSIVVEQLRERQEGLYLADLHELGEQLRQELPLCAPAAGPRMQGRKRPASPPQSRKRADTDRRQNGAGVADDDFVAMLTAGKAPTKRNPDEQDEQPSAPGSKECSPLEIHPRTAKQKHSPAVLMEVDSPDVLVHLEKLDDVVFDAMAGDARALEEMSRLWPQLVSKLGPDKLEESREQYLRCSLAVWENCLEDGLREPERALASLQVLAILFGEK